jgi:hypothetical protein
MERPTSPRIPNAADNRPRLSEVRDKGRNARIIEAIVNRGEISSMREKEKEEKMTRLAQEPMLLECIR